MATPYQSNTKEVNKMAHSRQYYIDNNDFEGAKERLDNTNDRWRSHWYETCVEIFNACSRDSQLVVVDCNPALLEEDLLRKDSVWFAQKGTDNSTEYFSLADFKSTKGKISVYDKYLQGMFGAVPLESEFYFVHDGTPAVKKEDN
jgi:hypothetical protein